MFHVFLPIDARSHQLFSSCDAKWFLDVKRKQKRKPLIDVGGIRYGMQISHFNAISSGSLQ